MKELSASAKGFLRYCPYFVGPFMTKSVAKARSQQARKQKAREAFVGPPKPKKHGNIGLKYETRTTEFGWAKDLDLSTKEGKREYSKRYYRHKWSVKKGHAKFWHLTAEEKREAANKLKSVARKTESEQLKDRHVRKEIKKQLGVKNPPQELIEAKRVQLRITRALREMVKTPAN